MKAEEARQIANRTIKLTDDQIHDQISNAARNGSFSTIFDPRQFTDASKKTLKQLGYRLIEETYTITVAWNLLK